MHNTFPLLLLLPLLLLTPNPSDALTRDHLRKLVDDDLHVWNSLGNADADALLAAHLTPDAVFQSSLSFSPAPAAASMKGFPAMAPNIETVSVEAVPGTVYFGLNTNTVSFEWRATYVGRGADKVALLTGVLWLEADEASGKVKRIIDLFDAAEVLAALHEVGDAPPPPARPSGAISPDVLRSLALVHCHAWELAMSGQGAAAVTEFVSDDFVYNIAGQHVFTSRQEFTEVWGGQMIQPIARIILKPTGPAQVGHNAYLQHWTWVAQFKGGGFAMTSGWMYGVVDPHTLKLTTLLDGFDVETFTSQVMASMPDHEEL